MAKLSTEFLQRYEFDWELLDVIVGGKSAIDSRNHLRARSSEDIESFMDCYGYDLSNPIEKAELFGNFQEALSFIRKYFLKPDNPDGLKLEIPRKITEITDIAQLLGAAMLPEPNPGQATTGLWACAILKVMHTVAHMDKDLRGAYFKDVQTQIFDRFYKFIHSDENGQVYLGKDARDPERVDLALFESKPKKARDSLVLKMLHKPENVAEDIFDRVGMRFVVKNRFDALRIIKFLKDRYVIMPANIKPSRSRNTLIDTRAFSEHLRNLLDDLQNDKLPVREFEEKLVEFFNAKTGLPKADLENPHTSEFYESIQFTGRQLVKIKNPLYDDLKDLKTELAGVSGLPEKVLQIVERMDLTNIQKEIRFFYPFEVQIYDEASYKEAQEGQSSHSNYKKSQIQAAMKRVMSGLIVYYKDQLDL
ncbi:MAG: TIGR04552 family protein [Bacteriovoracia bacterium]